MDKITYIGLTMILFMLILSLCGIAYGVNHYQDALDAMTERTIESNMDDEITELPIFHETLTSSGETTEVPETVSETEPETEPETTREIIYYYDVPLSDSLQDHIFSECEKYGIDPAIIIAMIYRESSYRENVVGDNGNSFGLMQINAKWHEDRMKKLGVTDLLDPYQNVTVGINYLAELYRYKGNMKWAIMAYNGGYSYADRWYDKGKFSSYVEEVLAMSEELKRDIPG